MVASFVRRMEALTGWRVNPEATLEELVDATRRSGDVFEVWEMISLPAEDPQAGGRV